MIYELPEQQPRIHNSEKSQRKTTLRDRYHARHVTISLKPRTTEWNHCRSFPCRQFRDVITAQLEADERVPQPARVFADTLDRVMNPGRDRDTEPAIYEGTLSVTLKFVAERKGDIIDEETAMSLVDVDRVVDHIVRAFDTVVAEYTEQQAHELRVRHANSVLRHMAEIVRERARTEVRYEQRKAALDAEYEAEKQAQTKKLLAELEKDGGEQKFEDGTVIDQRAVDAAITRLGAAVKGGEGFLGRRSNGDQIKSEDVK